MKKIIFILICFALPLFSQGVQSIPIVKVTGDTSSVSKTLYDVYIYTSDGNMYQGNGTDLDLIAKMTGDSTLTVKKIVADTATINYQLTVIEEALYDSLIAVYLENADTLYFGKDAYAIQHKDKDGNLMWSFDTTGTVFDFTTGTFTFGSDATDTTKFTGLLNLDNLTASRLLYVDSDKNVKNTDVASWIDGTANEVTIADDGDGTSTASLPDSIVTRRANHDTLISEHAFVDTLGNGGGTVFLDMSIFDWASSILQLGAQTTDTTKVSGDFYIKTARYYVDGSNNINVAPSGGIHNYYGIIRTGSGTPSAPSLSFTGDTNTGVRNPGADSLGAYTGGALALLIDENQDAYFSGNVGIGEAKPAWPLTVKPSTGNQGILIENSDSTATTKIYMSEETATDTLVIDPTSGQVVIYGDLSWNFVHGYGFFADSSITINVPDGSGGADATYIKITNAANDLFGGIDADGITVAGDSATILTAGDYRIEGYIDMTAANGDNMSVGVFKNNVKQWSRSSLFSAAATTGAIGVDFYLDGLVAGDDISIRIANRTDASDPTIIDGGMYIWKVHN